YQASKLFYRDIIEQIRAQRAAHPDYKVSRRNLTNGNGKVIDDPVASFSDMTTSLPLFRSNPIYGWNHEGEDLGLADPYEAEITDWSNWVNRGEESQKLSQRWSNIKTNVLPKIKTTLEELKSVVKDPQIKPEVQKVAQILTSSEDKDIASALAWISYYSSKERAEYMCTKSVNPAYAENGRAGCPMTYIQGLFLDPEVYQWSDEKSKYLFRNYESNQAMGFNTNFKVDPFGMQSLGPGQEYLMNYENKFFRADVDPNFYKAYQDAMNSETMVEYLLKKMVCGPQPDVYTQSLQRKQTLTGLRLHSPEFVPPGLPLKRSLQICAGTVPQILPARVGQYVGTRGWASSSDFYHSITDKRGPKYGTYAGIVDLLYQELDIDKIGDFDFWWDKNIKPQFEKVLELKQQQFNDLVIHKQLGTALNKKSDNDDKSKAGVFEAMEQQLNDYFKYYLDPMAEEIEIEDKFASDIPKGQLRSTLLKNYKSIKSDLFELFRLLKGDIQHLSNSELQKELEKQAKEAGGENVQLKLGADLQDQPIAQVLAVYSLAVQKLYDLKILFRANNSESFTIVIDKLREIIAANNELTAEQKEAKNEELTELQNETLEGFDSDTYRIGKVILNHPIDESYGDLNIKPRAEVIAQMLLGIELIFAEAGQYVQLRDQFKTI
ncbi:MAG: hypothetical protein KDD22_06505, partial [Bdellovibrionales bacterium]|nr:hypothetical protein [Bdellovibrionales bacterium]